MRNLVRTKNGRMIHKQACHMARRGAAVPWLWADRVSADRLLEAVAQFGYRECNRCQPLTAIQRLAPAYKGVPPG